MRTGIGQRRNRKGSEGSCIGGNKTGGLKARSTNLKNDPRFYAKIGALGGAASRTGGFAAGEAGRRRARIYGAIGGSISTRNKRKRTPEERAKIRQRILKQKAYQHLLKVHERAQR